jgi:hypothetical protein
MSESRDRIRGFAAKCASRQSTDLALQPRDECLPVPPFTRNAINASISNLAHTLYVKMEDHGFSPSSERPPFFCPTSSEFKKNGRTMSPTTTKTITPFPDAKEIVCSLFTVAWENIANSY